MTCALLEFTSCSLGFGNAILKISLGYKMHKYVTYDIVSVILTGTQTSDMSRIDSLAESSNLNSSTAYVQSSPH